MLTSKVHKSMQQIVIASKKTIQNLSLTNMLYRHKIPSRTIY